MVKTELYDKYYDTYTKIWKDYFQEIYSNWDMSLPDEHTAIYHLVFADLRAADMVYRAHDAALYLASSAKVLDSDDDIANRAAHERVQSELREAWNEMFEDCKHYGQQSLINK